MDPTLFLTHYFFSPYLNQLQFQALTFWVSLSFFCQCLCCLLIGMTLCIVFKMLFRYFNCNALSGDFYLAASCYIAPCFEAQYAFKGAFCSTLPKTLTFDSWQIPQMRSPYNWTFINHPLLRATKFPRPLFSSETFSKPLKDEIRKQVYLPRSMFYFSSLYQIRV